MQLYFVRLRTELHGLLRDNAGATAVEFAVLAPVLCLMAAGAIDATTLILRTMEVRSAAQAGADVALVHGWDAGKIALAVAANSGTPARVSASPAPSYGKACVSGTTITAAAGSACPGGGAPGDFVTVRAKAHFQPIVPWPGFEKDLVSQATVRLK